MYAIHMYICMLYVCMCICKHVIRMYVCCIGMYMCISMYVQESITVQNESVECLTSLMCYMSKVYLISRMA